MLIGTGASLTEIPDRLKEYLFKRKIKFEIMNSISAYKTYNILLSEGRNIVSILKVLG